MAKSSLIWLNLDTLGLLWVLWPRNQGKHKNLRQLIAFLRFLSYCVKLMQLGCLQDGGKVCNNLLRLCTFAFSCQEWKLTLSYCLKLKQLCNSARGCLQDGGRACDSHLRLCVFLNAVWIHLKYCLKVKQLWNSARGCLQDGGRVCDNRLRLCIFVFSCRECKLILSYCLKLKQLWNSARGCLQDGGRVC